jgi:hypothetical protein
MQVINAINDDNPEKKKFKLTVFIKKMYLCRAIQIVFSAKKIFDYREEGREQALRTSGNQTVKEMVPKPALSDKCRKGIITKKMMMTDSILSYLQKTSDSGCHFCLYFILWASMCML